MANSKHLKILDQGIDAWNEWRKQKPSIRPNLNNAVLSGAALGYGNFSNAKLSWAHFIEADLSYAVLSGADLSYANFSDANLRYANFSYAALVRANLSGADLSNANVHGVFFGYTVFGDVNLNSVKALDSCTHIGPSYLDFRTLAKSGNLPLNFLHDCGLSDEFINYLPSLSGQAIEYYSCFISYSTKDQEFAERIHDDLQNRGVRCWYAKHDIQGGKKIDEQIEEAIRKYERLLLILSEASMKSEWVKTEIANALQKGVDENRRVLFPIALVDYSKITKWKCFDADRGKDSAREIREYFIPDFSNWKDHDSYQKAFEHLLRDLKPEKVEAKPK